MSDIYFAYGLLIRRVGGPVMTVIGAFLMSAEAGVVRPEARAGP